MCPLRIFDVKNISYYVLATILLRKTLLLNNINGIHIGLVPN